MTNIFDHIGINVSDITKSVAFYSKALAPLGIELVSTYDHHAGFGKKKRPQFWISGGKTSFQNESDLNPITPMHICLAAKDKESVDAFYQAALAAGGRDFGQPGLRPHYHANYYGAFVLDPDGHNIEAVCHTVRS